MGRGRKEEELQPFLSPIVPRALTIPYFLFLFLVEYPAGASAGWGQEVKRHLFFFKEIAGKMVRHELTNIERQENWTFQFSQTNKYIYVVSAVNLNQPVIEANGDNVIYVLHEHENNLLNAE